VLNMDPPIKSGDDGFLFRNKFQSEVSMSVLRNEIVNFLNKKLSVSEIADSSNNGLQVQGSDDVGKIGLAVDACLATYEQAVKEKCDMLIVHHGLIWDGLDSVTGRNYKHVKYLINNHLNLYAAHLPLDMHAEVGNNSELVKLLSLKDVEPFGDYKGTVLSFQGRLESPMTNEELSKKLQGTLNGDSTILPFGPEKNETIALVAGRGASMFKEAVDKGVDCFLTGEGIYEDYHLAKESGINVIYLGHYHSEQLGVQALGRLLKATFNIQTTYLNEPPIC